MKSRLAAPIMMLIMMITGCSNNLAPAPEPEDIVLTPKSQQLVSAGNTFTFNLLNRIPHSSGHNVMVSPLSISLALSMTLNGAEGLTKADMISALGLNDLGVDEINQIYFDLITALKKADSRVVMNIANSIWIRKSFSVLEPFIAANQHYYDARVESLDFNQAGLNTINNWVNEKTNSKIPKIIDQISAEEVMFLINAIYFNGKWQIQFEKSKTQEGAFGLGAGGSVNVPLMKVKDNYGYSEQSGYEALKMPYGRGKFGMIILLPDVGKTPDQIVKQITPTAWENLKTSLATPLMVDVWLPRFKFTWESDLKDLLSSLGMSVAFSPDQADFSKINSGGHLFISKVKHKTFIDVNEEGTEAAAATSVGIGVTSVGPGGLEFHVTRPFLFFITEEDTGAILFAGKVENPLMEN